MTIDHLCRTPPCVNPHHLEVVTNAENVRRIPWTLRSHCGSGHEFTEANTGYRTRASGSTYRYCIECTRIRARASWLRRKAEADA